MSILSAFGFPGTAVRPPDRGNYLCKRCHRHFYKPVKRRCPFCQHGKYIKHKGAPEAWER